VTTIFRIGTDGNNFSLLHSFGSGSDGAYPCGSLTLIGSTLYGTTFWGGNNGNSGTIFQIGTDGSGYSTLHLFGGGGDGANPHGNLTQNGSTLYGMTEYGGSISGANEGTIFQIGTDGSGYNVLHSFAGGGEGSVPIGSLTLSGSTLYGMTDYGGSKGDGTVFSINTNGTGFSVLHSFTGSDGAGTRSCTLTLIGSTLYGMTVGGGNDDGGTIFRIGTDGNNFSLLHSFGSGSDGVNPADSLTLVGSTLYGTTLSGGAADYGTIFAINTDGSDYKIVHSFTKGDGLTPSGDLMLDGSTLYGTTTLGGDEYDGVIFSLTVPEPSTFVLLGIGALGLLGYPFAPKPA
jgi:uncharacterized repeat protein (TIGR03803 family)